MLLPRRLAIFFLLIALGGVGYYFWSVPAVLRVAVGPRDTEQVRFISALAEAFETSSQPFRLIPVIAEDSEAASAALDSGAVKLAVVRSDDLTSSEARSIAILHRRALVILARSDRAKQFGDLRGKRILSVQGATDSNLPLVERIFSHLGLGPKDASITASDVSAAEAALIGKKADALVFVAPPAGTKLRELVVNLTKAKVPLSFIKVPGTEALVVRFSYLQSMQVPAGVFGGAPPKPPENMESVGITYELVASRSMSDRVAAELTKALQYVRVRKSSHEGATFTIESPPTDEVRRFMPHAGTKAYLDNEAKTWIETYSDYIWLALFGFGLIGSSVTGVLAWIGFRKPAVSVGLVHTLPSLLDRVASAQTHAELDEVQRDFDEVVAASLRDYSGGVLGEEDANRPIWLSQMQLLIEHRRDRINLPPESSRNTS
jgi:hypothetical protein